MRGLRAPHHLLRLNSCSWAAQKYEPHHDFFHDQVNARPENGGQRIATVLMYLCAPASLVCLYLNVGARNNTSLRFLTQIVCTHMPERWSARPQYRKLMRVLSVS